jgi:2-phosphosulfolactate phosphatase
MNGGPKTVVIDCFPQRLARYCDGGWTVVAVDVIRATTTAVTAVAGGRRCYPAPTLEAALALAARLDDPLLAGELGGSVPYGFEERNSPARVARRTDVDRPMVLLSTSGTRLISRTGPYEAVYAACLRNHTAQVERLAGRHERVLVIGAGARCEFREEDQLACAWIAGGLIEAGYEPLGETAGLVARWRDTPVEAVAGGKSAEYLRRTGQVDDLDFILTHVDDIAATFELNGEGLVMQPDAHRKAPSG